MVPKDGDTKIELEIENMHIIIDKIKEHQVEHAIIEILDKILKSHLQIIFRKK